ncbi:hypothetical protein GD1_77 [Paraglaciecola Antarctic GD virus 1]|nr:hypothetical protein GD1_77 [Paraglaciecola Antarctic GD virus 1]
MNNGGENEEFDDSLSKTIDELEKIVKFVYMTKLGADVVKMYVTDVEYQDNGFIIEFFTDDVLSEENEAKVRKHLADDLLERMNKMQGA